MPQTIFISAGEASGEHYGALLVTALQKQLGATGQKAAFFGMGGERMKAAGLDCVVRSEEMAVMGLTEVVLHLPRIWREFQRLKQAVRQRRPNVAVLIDFPEIHFRIAKELHRQGIPVIFFVSPQLWAWKKKRIRLVQKYIDKMLVIFPFEEPFYRERGVEAEFVGHPLAELPGPSISREEFAKQTNAMNLDIHSAPPADCPPEERELFFGNADYELDPGKKWIALLPGSRHAEIASNFHTMVKAAIQLGSGYQFIVPLAPTLTGEQIRAVKDELNNFSLPDDAPLISFVRDARAALFHARASIVASGTATVEAALIGNPFVVVYRVSALTYAIAKRVVKVPFVAMANLIAGKQVVPELIQDKFTAKNIMREIEPLLSDGPPRQSMMEELARIRSLLCPVSQLAKSRVGAPEIGAIERVAEVTLETMTTSMSKTESGEKTKMRRSFQAHGTARTEALIGMPLAAPWQRFMGFYIDLLFAVILWGPLEYGWQLLVLHETKIHVVWDFHEMGNVIVMLLYWGLLNYFGNGRTPGKWIARTRIISLTSERMGLWQSFERALGYGAAVLEGGLGVIQIFWDRNRMCAQDRLAETIVVDLRKRAN
jgi:lipid-A-disaccharide synthase